MIKKKIVNITPLSPGSPPDVDTDFSKDSREHAISYVTEEYGKDNVCSIVTFGTLKSKGAFKAICTINGIPFQEANAMTKKIPDPVEGEEFDLKDTFNEEADTYDSAEEFRNYLDTDERRGILDSAIGISGRNRATGIHAAGVVISRSPLEEVIPTQFSKENNKLVSQWIYHDLEEIGLIKMDFLGLETIDIIQRAVEYSMRNGKDIPSMESIINGEMDDPEVYDMFQKGHTVGIFQFGSNMVIDLLKKIMPTKFGDLSATTAIARPGPMGMDSHNKYAKRKNGLEPIDFIHKDFIGSPLEKILGETYGLLVYQEQVMQIASEIAGMTLQQGDDLRSAMGKKKIEVMESMKPLFFEGAKSNGYSEEAVTVLWNTIAEMAKYGFNKAHSVSYAINSYQSAYLKVHYPVEFMSSLIAQATKKGDKDKIREFLKECSRMGVKVLPPDVNISESDVAPNFVTGGNNIVYGLSALSHISEHNANIIVKEREENGTFKSVDDFVQRCYKKGIRTAKVYESIAKSGGFDSIEKSRRGVVEAIPELIKSAKKSMEKGESLFDMFDDVDGEFSIIINEDDYSYSEKLMHEADMIGLYVSGHPLDRVEKGIIGNSIKSITIKNKKNTYTSVFAITDVSEKTTKKGFPKIQVGLDDGTGYINANLSPDAIKCIQKYNNRETVMKAFVKGETSVIAPVKASVLNQEIPARAPIVANAVYIANVTYTPSYDHDSSGFMRVNWILPLTLSNNGTLPIRMRFDKTQDPEKVKRIFSSMPKKLSEKIPGDSEIFRAVYKGIDSIPIARGDENYIEAISIMSSDGRNPNYEKHERSWPPVGISDRTINHIKKNVKFYEDTEQGIESLEYRYSGYSTEKSQRVESGIEKYLGYNSYDFGVPKAVLKEV